MSRAVLLHGPMDVDVLRDALRCVQRRYPLLQSRCAWHKNDLVFQLSDSFPEPRLQVVPRQADDDWQRQWQDELHRPLDIAAYPWRVILLRPGAGGTNGELIVSNHHAISDAISSTALVHRILCYYAEILARGRVPEVAPEPVLDPVELLATGPPPWQRMARFAIAHLGRLFRCGTGHLFAGARRGTVAVADRQTRILYHDFGTNPSRAFFDRCHAEGATVYGALCAAMLITARAYVLNPKKRMTCSSSISLRRRCTPPIPEDQFGCFFYWVDTCHRVRDKVQFWKLARSCSRKVRRAARCWGCPAPIVFAHAGIARHFIGGSLRRVMNNAWLGRTDTIGIANIGRLSVRDSYGPLHVRGLYSATAQHVVGVCAALIAGTFCDRLLVSFPHVRPLLDEDQAQAFLAGVIDQVRKACAA